MSMVVLFTASDNFGYRLKSRKDSFENLSVVCPRRVGFNYKHGKISIIFGANFLARTVKNLILLLAQEK